MPGGVQDVSIYSKRGKVGECVQEIIGCERRKGFINKGDQYFGEEGGCRDWTILAGGSHGEVTNMKGCRDLTLIKKLPRTPTMIGMTMRV